MLAKVIQTRRSGLTPEAIFKARVGYCCRKACAIAIENLAGHWRDAAFQMGVSATLHDRLRDPSCHIVLSWADGENPGDTEIIEAARMAVRELGAGAHQHVIAVHRDRRNVHGHILLNRVHPLTGAALSLSHDFARLERACRRIEHHFGWPPDRGRFNAKIVNGDVQLMPKPSSHWENKRAEREAGVRQDPRGVRGACRRSGRRPLRDRLPSETRHAALAVLRGAATWATLHAGLLKLGLLYLAHGSGARIEETITRDWMPACHMGAAFTLPRLVARLGQFVSGRIVRDQKLAAHPGEHDRYRRDRQARRDELARRRHQQHNQRHRLSEALKGLSRPVAAAFRLALRQEQREDLIRARKATPLPCLRDYGLERDAAPPDPATEWALRYRHILRRFSARKDGYSLLPPPFDHTHLRRIWHMRFRDEVGQHQVPRPEENADVLARLGDGSLMIPRRGTRGDIVGFDVVAESPDGELVNIANAPRQGLGMLGDRDGKRCIVVSNAAVGIRISVKNPDALIIIASETPTLLQAAQIREFIGPRRACDVLVSLRVRAPSLAQLTSVRPDFGGVDPSAWSDRPDVAVVVDEEEDDLPSPSPD